VLPNLDQAKISIMPPNFPNFPEPHMREALYWLVQNSADVPDHDDWLTKDERGIMEGMRFAKRRNDWRLGRWTAKLAIRAYRINDAPQLSSLEIRAAADGAPESFWNDEPANISISISHSNGRSLCAVGPRSFAIGCDLESIEPREDYLVQDYFTAEEASLCRNSPAGDNALTVNLIWCAKEAVLKALREGLRRDTRSIIIRPDARNGEGVWTQWTGNCRETSRIFHGWWRSCDGYIHTLASDRPTRVPEQLRI
jgi:4'-phosphopantetheinyl transferase